jgi:hypothetical protein
MLLWTGWLMLMPWTHVPKHTVIEKLKNGEYIIFTRVLLLLYLEENCDFCQRMTYTVRFLNVVWMETTAVLPAGRRRPSTCVWQRPGIPARTPAQPVQQAVSLGFCQHCDPKLRKSWNSMKGTWEPGVAQHTWSGLQLTHYGVCAFSGLLWCLGWDVRGS